MHRHCVCEHCCKNNITISSFFPHSSLSRAVCPIRTAQSLKPEHEVVPKAPGSGPDCGSVYSPEVNEPRSLLVKPFVNLIANSERVQRPVTWPRLGEFSGEQ